jgi:PEGA domain
VANAPVSLTLDGFGPRTNGIDPETGDEIERLDLAPLLVEHSAFVTTLAERVARLAAVRHASYVHLRRLDRPDADRLELISDFTPGWRLSELLDESSAAGIPVDITVVISLLRQLLPAVALFSRHNREAAIGVLAVERLIVTPQARLVIAEHAFGPALEKLNFGRERLWRDLRIVMPESVGLPRANQRSDAYAIGVIALSLILGRVLTADEYPEQIDSLLGGLNEHRGGQPSPLSAAFGNWLKRALQLDPKTAFQTPSEMQLAFEAVLASDRSYVTTTAKFEEWIANVGAPIEMRKRPPAPEPPPLPPEPEPESAYARAESGELRRDHAEATLGREGGPEPVARVVEEVDPIAEQIASYRPSYQEAQAPEPVPEPERKPAPSPVLYDVSPVVEDPEVAPYVLPPIVETPDPVAAETASPEPAAYEESQAAVEYVPAPVAEETDRVAEEASNEAASTDETASEPPSIWTAVEAVPPADAVPVDAYEPPVAPARSKLPLAAFAGVIALLLVVIGWLWMSRGSGGIREGEGELAVQSRPPGARVIVDGKERGMTPTTVRLPAGPHVLEVQVGKAEPRVIPLTITAGVQTSQYIELRDVVVTGSLSIKSEPSGARITIDGQPRGTTPATIPNLTAGDHAVVLELGGRKASQAVKIEPGSAAQLTVPMPRR